METRNYLEIANDGMLWVMCIPIILIVGAQAFLFTKKAFDAAHVTTLEHSQCMRAFRVGATSAIGPSLAVFIVMVAMMGVVGAPVTWMRLSMIGAANTELTASTIGAQAMGVQFGSAEYKITEFANSVWTMALNGCGWLVFCGLFTDKLEILQDKVAGGDRIIMQRICGAAVLGTASYLVASNTKGIDGGIAMDRISAAIIAAIFMIILDRLGKKYPKILEYTLGIAMICGMFIGVVVANNFGG